MDVLSFFEEVAKKIHEFEDKAKVHLADGKNELYIKEMQQKAETLASLVIEVKKFDLSNFDSEKVRFIQYNVDSFSKSAQTAINLNSTWYMSQLLFDEDYKEGAPNNFDLFLAKLR